MRTVLNVPKRYRLAQEILRGCISFLINNSIFFIVNCMFVDQCMVFTNIPFLIEQNSSLQAYHRIMNRLLGRVITDACGYNLN